MGEPAAYVWQYDRSPFDRAAGTTTFSVGIYQWIPKATGAGLKRSNTIRVLGYVADPECVYSKADELCRRLNKEQAHFDALPNWVQKQYSVARPSSAKKITVKDRVTEMARLVWEPALIELGFRRVGRRFWRDTPKVCHVIDLAMGRWGTSTEGSFEVDMGVFWHEVEAILRNPARSRMPPPVSACTYQMPLGWTLPRDRRQNWDITLSTKLDAIGRESLADLVRHGLRWLEFRSELKNTQNLTKYLKKINPNEYTSQEIQTGWSSVVFLVMLGKRVAAKKELASYLTGGPSDTSVFSVAKQLGLEIPSGRSEWAKETR